jgi:hypothetical protein
MDCFFVFLSQINMYLCGKIRLYYDDKTATY